MEQPNGKDGGKGGREAPAKPRATKTPKPAPKPTKRDPREAVGEAVSGVAESLGESFARWGGPKRVPLALGACGLSCAWILWMALAKPPAPPLAVELSAASSMLAQGAGAANARAQADPHWEERFGPMRFGADPAGLYPWAARAALDKAACEELVARAKWVARLSEVDVGGRALWTRQGGVSGACPEGGAQALLRFGAPLSKPAAPARR